MELYDYFSKLTPFNFEAFRLHQVFLVVCIIYISVVLIKWSTKRKRWIRALDQFPGPPGHWLLGHVTEFKEDGTDLEKFLKWGEQYPFAFSIQFSPDSLFLLVHHPSYVKPILATLDPKDDFVYRFLLPWIGNVVPEQARLHGGPEWAWPTQSEAWPTLAPHHITANHKIGAIFNSARDTLFSNFCPTLFFPLLDRQTDLAHSFTFTQPLR
ncbi:cytochrome P450 4B1-like [Tachysurus vachellii]|uniref:cytochrome P450 4B1-like n=1 Tax=Tachysurus vachellii TaxID=175792 RepID=UPI00296AB089|nr:cytochrome P450 4B1-like [Tachysurus vachellii]